MPRAHNLTDREIGLLIVREIGEPGAAGVRRWRCECRCGTEVLATATDLVSERVWACPDCGGPVPKAPRPGSCPVCKQSSDNGVICSAECREARRRGRKKGVDHLPQATYICEICGKSFVVSRGTKKTCSPECRAERKRRRWLQNYYHRIERDPDLGKKISQRRRERAETDPEYADKVREWDAKRQANFRVRMEADPKYAAARHARINAYYAANRTIILAQRQARHYALTPEQLASWLERARQYHTKWARKMRADRATDPIEHQRYKDYMNEYRRQRNRLKLLGGVLNATSTLGERLHATNNGTDSDRQNERRELAGYPGGRIRRIGPSR